ncbi:hypothetical protein [Caldisericum sp.]
MFFGTKNIAMLFAVFRRNPAKSTLKAEERAKILFEAEKKKLIRQFEQA